MLTRHLVGVPGLTHSLEGDAPDNTTVLVQGRPSEDTLRRCTSLHTLIIPFAGLPGETRDRVIELNAARAKATAAQPALRVFNLHINAGATAEMALALLLAAMKKVLPMDAAMRRGDWTQRFSPTGFGSLVQGSVAVVVGFGAIGSRIAEVLLVLGARTVRAVRGSHPAEAAPANAPCGNGQVQVHSAGRLLDAMRGASVVVVTCPLTDATRGSIGKAELAVLSPGAVLVNVGRGPVVDQEALFQALESGALGGAGIDVW